MLLQETVGDAPEPVEHAVEQFGQGIDHRIEHAVVVRWARRYR